MRIGVISDSHGCLTGLRTVVEWLWALGVDDIVCAGDVASFGPCPNECIEFLRAQAIPTVQGNEDLNMVQPHPRETQSQRIAEIEAIEAWGRSKLTADNARWLEELPGSLEPAPGLLIVHAAPGDLLRIVTAEDEPMFPPGTETIAAGHLHRPFIARMRHGLWVNAGSVARPCDGDARGSCAVLERRDGVWDAEIHRIAFDLNAAVANIEKAGMPYADRLAQTLIEARWW